MHHIKEIVQANKIIISIYIGIGFISAFLTNYKAIYFQKVMDGLVDHSVQTAQIWIYGILLMAGFLISYLDELPAKKLEYGICLDFKLLALHKVSRIAYLEYQKIGTGKLVQKIENGAEAGKNLLYDFWLCLIRQLIPTIFFSVYFIWRINRPITYMILVGYIVIFIITNFLLKALYQIKERILVNEEQMNHFMVRGFMEMLVFRMEKQFPNEIRKAVSAKKEIVRAKVKMNMIHESFFTIFALLVAMLNIGILIYAWNTRSISVGAVVALLSLIDNAYTPIAIFNVLYVQYKLDKTAFRRYDEFLCLKEDFQLEAGMPVAECTGSVAVDGLSFGYGGHRLFEGLKLEINKGEKIVFVGESGSGKTTLIRLLAGLIKYEDGSMRLDGNEIKDLCLDSLYDHMSYISQDSPILDGTLRENLVFDKKIDDDKLIQALQKVQLRPLFETWKEGLETEIGERGAMLSGGERQRVALARLWFEQKEITILDEATSALDNLTEELVMQEVLQLLDKQTVIAVAHRLTFVADFDRIVVFKQGRIVGQGTFEELMVNNPYFIELYHASEAPRMT